MGKVLSNISILSAVVTAALSFYLRDMSPISWAILVSALIGVFASVGSTILNRRDMKQIKAATAITLHNAAGGL
jgi:hypothetical protein